MSPRQVVAGEGDPAGAGHEGDAERGYEEDCDGPPLSLGRSAVGIVAICRTLHNSRALENSPLGLVILARSARLRAGDCEARALVRLASTSTRPSWASMMRWTKASPRPRPP